MIKRSYSGGRTKQMRAISITKILEVEGRHGRREILPGLRSRKCNQKYKMYESPQPPIHFGFFVWGARLSPQLRHPTAPPKTPTSTFPEAPDLPRGICRRPRYWRIHRARWRRWRASGALGRARGVTVSVPQRGSAPRRQSVNRTKFLVRFV